MARRKTQSDKAEGAVERPVDKNQLIALIKESYATIERASSITGVFGERVKAAVENGRLNKGVFSLVCKLHRMEELKRQAFIRDLELYLDMIEEAGLWGHQHVGDLEDGMQGEDEQSEDERIAAENAKALRGLTALADGNELPAQSDDGPDDAEEHSPAVAEILSRPKSRKPALASVDGEPVH
jgi:hypothetical protein